MPQITAADWKVLEQAFLAAGFRFARQEKSHRSDTKADLSRPVVIPTHNEVPMAIIRNNLKTAGMTRFEDAPQVWCVEVVEGVVVDLDEQDRLAGLEILDATRQVNVPAILRQIAGAETHAPVGGRRTLHEAARPRTPSTRSPDRTRA